MKKIITLFSMLLFITPLQSLFSQAQVGGTISGEFGTGSSVSFSSVSMRVAVGNSEGTGSGNLSGYVGIYEFNGTDWVQMGSNINGKAAGDRAGEVALSQDGKRVALGAPMNSDNGTNSGHVRIFEWVGGSWVQLGSDINGEASGDNFGSSVSISFNGKRVAIGAPGNDANGQNAGQVRIFRLINGEWVQFGQDLNGQTSNEFFGSKVALSLDGARVAMGGSGINAVRAYKVEGSSWAKHGPDINGEASGDNFGSSISMSTNGARVAIGGSKNSAAGIDAGHARVYQVINGAWEQVGEDIDGEAAGDNFGSSISISSDGEKVAIGGFFNSDNGTKAGHARVYELTNGSWSQIGADIDGEAVGDHLGSSVFLSGNMVVVGARGTSGGNGYAKVFDIYGIQSQDCSLMAHFPLDDADADDVSGNNYFADVIGGVYTATDRFGKPEQAAEFDGIDGAISYRSTLGNFGLNDFSISLWLSTTLTSTQRFIGKRPICNHSNFWNVMITSGKIGVELDENSAGSRYHSVLGKTLVNDGNWHHIVVTRKGPEVKVYVDNMLEELEITSNYSQTINLDNSADFLIGAEICGTFKGYIDEVKVYNCALEENNIRDLFTVSNQPLIEQLNISIYPNPSSGKVTIESESSKIESVELYDLMGRKLAFTALSSNFGKTTIQTDYKGMALLRIKSEGQLMSRKILFN
jgi:hypothetical protein